MFWLVLQSIHGAERHKKGKKENSEKLLNFIWLEKLRHCGAAVERRCSW